MFSIDLWERLHSCNNEMDLPLRLWSGFVDAMTGCSAQSPRPLWPKCLYFCCNALPSDVHMIHFIRCPNKCHLLGIDFLNYPVQHCPFPYDINLSTHSPASFSFPKCHHLVRLWISILSFFSHWNTKFHEGRGPVCFSTVECVTPRTVLG